MVRRAALPFVALFLVAGGLVPASGQRSILSISPPGGFQSANLDYVGTIPLDSPGIGAKVVQVGAQRRFYVTGIKGLSIYDVTNPALPLPLGHLENPHWENEDVEVSADGNRVLISGDSFGSMVMWIIDASIPTAPRIAGFTFAGQHTVECVDAACNWVYGSEGDIFNLTNVSAPARLTTGWKRRIELQTGVRVGGGHNLNRAGDGRVVADTSPRAMLDVSNPAVPVTLTLGWLPDGANLAYQHNNLRPNAAAWTARASGDTDPLLRPGELLVSNGETNFTGTCGSGNGPLATWSVKDFDKGAPMTHIATLRPVSGNYVNGNPTVNAMGCSGHWFSVRNDIVAAGWYDHGIRLVSVNPQTGSLGQIGFFQPVVTEASAAHWIDDEYIYTVDYARGIDILRFVSSAAAPTTEEIDASWLAPTKGLSAFAQRERFQCRLAQTRA